MLLIEAAALITASVLRPWMDKKINSFNIAICAVNFVNAIFLLIFTNVFDQPDIVTGVIGVVLWVLNAAATLILLLVLIISTIIVFFTDNPDGRYKFMADDRTSFMKSQSQLAATGELDALAMTARGEKLGYGSGLDDNESLAPPSFRQAPRSRPQSINRPVPSVDTTSTSTIQNDPSRYSADQHSSLMPSNDGISRTASPSNHSISRAQNASPWQRGAGYDHE